MITIPQGGTVAGRAAQIEIAAPDTGGFIAQVGAQVAQKFGQIKAQQEAVQTERTKLDIVKEIGTERQRFDQMTDPAQIEAEWPVFVQGITDKYVNAKGADGKPLLTPQQADALGLTIQDITTRQGLALGDRAIKLTQSQATAAWTEAGLDIVNTAATADLDTALALIELGEGAIDQLPGLLPHEKAEAKAKLNYDVYNARAISASGEDPAGLVADLEAGEYNDLGAERVAALKVAAVAELDRIAAAEAKAAEADIKLRTDAIDKRLGTVADLTLKGRKVPDRDFVINAPPEVQALSNWAPAMAAIQLSDEIPDLELRTIGQLDELITAEKNREIVHPWEDQRLTVLQTMRDKKVTAYNTDPKAAAREAGLPAPDLPDFDPADPGAFAAGLADSISFAAYLREKDYTKRSAIFTLEQKDALKATIAPTAEAAPKVALMEAILQGSGGNAGAVLTDLEADPVFRRGLKFLGLTGDRGMTEAMLRGQQKIEGKTVTVPSRKEQIMAFDAATGGAFDDTPAVKEEVMATALALYADSAAGIDGETETADGWLADGAAYSLYQQSLQRLLGAQPDRSGALTIGGMQEVNGALTVLPMGVAVDDVEGAMEGLGNRLAGGVWDTGRGGGEWVYAAPEEFQAPDASLKSAPDTAARMAPFQAASIYGGVPDLGGNPSERLAALTLRRVGESNVYEFVYERNGRMTPVPEQGTGRAYRFRLEDLIGGVRK